MLSDNEKKNLAHATATKAKQIGWPRDYVAYFESNFEIYKVHDQLELHPFGWVQKIDDRIVDNFLKDISNGRFLCIGSAVGEDQTGSLIHKGWTGVYCDPDPLVFQGLMDNTAQWADNVTLVNAAIVPEPGIREFYVSRTQALSSVYAELAGAGSRKIVINPLTLDQLIDYVGNDFDYVQFDIEGLDDSVIKSFDWGKSLPRCKMIGVETGMFVWEHLWNTGGYILTDITEHNAYYRRLSTINSDKKLKNG